MGYFPQSQEDHKRRRHIHKAMKNHQLLKNEASLRKYRPGRSLRNHATGFIIAGEGQRPSWSHFKQIRVTSPNAQYGSYAIHRVVQEHVFPTNIATGQCHGHSMALPSLMFWKPFFFLNLNIKKIQTLWASLVAQTIKYLPAMQETWVWSLDREDPLEKGMVIHSSIIAWRIPWIEQPSGLHSLGSQRVRQDWAINTYLCAL